MCLQSMARMALFVVLASTQCRALLRDAAATNSYKDSRQNGSASKSAAAIAVEMRTDTEGVDFTPYLQDVYLSVKRRWFANMPPSIERGQQGTNAVEFRIQRDGSVPKDSVKMVTSSAKGDFDAASLHGIQDAIPFNHLPEKFSKPFILLRFTFYYNLPVPKNPQ